MQKGYTIVELLIVIAIIGLVVTGVIAGCAGGYNKELKLCSEFADTTINYIPVRCYDYYNIN